MNDSSPRNADDVGFDGGEAQLPEVDLYQLFRLYCCQQHDALGALLTHPESIKDHDKKSPVYLSKNNFYKALDRMPDEARRDFVLQLRRGYRKALLREAVSLSQKYKPTNL